MVTEDASTPFSVIGPQRRLQNGLVVYKLFSQAALTEDVLQRIFHNLTILAQRCAALSLPHAACCPCLPQQQSNGGRPCHVHREWLAYPKFRPPEQFQPFELTAGLYLNNAWENAASAMEMSLVASRNCVLLIDRHLHALKGAVSGLPGDGMKAELR